MDAPVLSKRVYRFGLFEADAESGKLFRQGMRVKLQDQPFRILCLLLERAGHIVTREELRQSLWSGDTYVEFDGSLNAALKRLRFALGDSADNPIFIETLPKRGYRFLAPVTAEQSSLSIPPAPQDSFSESPAEHEEGSSDNEVPVPLTHRMQDGLRRSAYGFALALLLVLGVASYHRLTSAGQNKREEMSQPRPVTPRVSVAVLGFNNAAGKVEDAWISTAFSEMLNTELSAGDRLRLVPAEDVAHLRLLSPWMQTATLGQETSSRIGLGLSSDMLVLGSYVSLGKPGKRQLRLDVRLQDASTGNVLVEVAEEDNEEHLFHLASVVGRRLRLKLGLQGNTPEGQAAELASMPSNPDAARFYALGLDKLREFDAQAAKDLLQQATAAEPSFPMSHSRLAQAWAQLGYEQKRKDEAKKALDLSINLPQVSRMQVEGNYYESQSNHEKAASIYGALFASFPDSIEYGLQLAAARSAAGHGSEALEAVAALRRLPLPASADPRIDLLEAKIITSKPEILGLVRKALGKASTQGNKLIYAQARRDECITLVYGEHPEQATASCEEAYTIFVAAGNRLGAADCVRLIGDLQGSGGKYEEAVATYQRALRVLEGLGEHEKTGAILNNMAGVFTNQGKLDRAEQLYRRAKSHFDLAGDGYNSAVALGNIGDILYLRGNLPAAGSVYQETIARLSAIIPSDPSYPMYRLADLELAEGRVKDAERHARQAIDVLRPFKGGYQYLTTAMIVLGDAMELQGDLKGARQQYQEALDIRQKMGEMDLVAENELSLAELALEEAHPEQAEPLLQPAIAEFERAKAEPDATSAYIALSRALLAENKVDQARKAIHHAAELAHDSPDPALKLPAGIQNARIEIASVRRGAAAGTALAGTRQRLRAILASARKLGYYNLQCEARLAMGELELKANPPLGRSLLKQLADDASGHGLQLISSKASSLAKSS
jgi:eukaryotic-like serine/threonine-protein kinase